MMFSQSQWTVDEFESNKPDILTAVNSSNLTPEYTTSRKKREWIPWSNHKCSKILQVLDRELGSYSIHKLGTFVMFALPRA